MINHPSAFVCRQVYEKYGGFDDSYRIAADYDFMLRLYYKDSSLFFPVYERIANFSAGSLSGTMSAELERDEILKKYGILKSRKYHMRKIVRTIKKWIGY